VVLRVYLRPAVAGRWMNSRGPDCQIGVIATDAWVPAHHLSKTIGICCAATILRHSSKLEAVVRARFRYTASLLMSSPFFMMTVNAV
jgi:hypothetical protein